MTIRDRAVKVCEVLDKFTDKVYVYRYKTKHKYKKDICELLKEEYDYDSTRNT